MICKDKRLKYIGEDYRGLVKNKEYIIIKNTKSRYNSNLHWFTIKVDEYDKRNVKSDDRRFILIDTPIMKLKESLK